MNEMGGKNLQKTQITNKSEKEKILCTIGKLLESLPFYVVLVNYVFCFLPSLTVLFEKLVEFAYEVGFAFATQHFSRSASAFSLCQLRIIFFKEVEVILEDAANGWVRACFSLLRRRAFAARESIPDFLLHHIRRVHGKYACFRHGGAHFSACR
jgi:hypothetical protein